MGRLKNYIQGKDYSVESPIIKNFIKVYKDTVDAHH